MKRGKKLLSLTLVLAVLLGAYALLRRSAEKKEAAEAAAEKAAVIVLSDRSSAEVRRICWNYGEEETMLIQTDGVWSDPNDAAFPVNPGIALRMADAVASVRSDRRLDSTQDLAPYGLDTPALIVTAEYSDGSCVSYSIGSFNELAGQYYARCEDGIYMLDSTIFDAFSVTRWSLIQPEELPSLDNATALRVETPAASLSLRYHADGGSFYTDEYKWFPDGDLSHPADNEAVQTLLDTLTNLDLSRVAAYDVTAEELERWGLTKPQGRVTAEYTDADGQTASLVMELGNCSDEGYYARQSASPMVYLIDATAAESFLTLQDETALRPDEVCRIDIDSIRSLDVFLDGKEYHIDVSNKPVTSVVTDAASGEEQEENGTESLYTLDGAELESAALRSVLAQIYAMNAEATDGDESLAGETVLRICYHRNSKSQSEMDLIFRHYNDSRYLAEFNGRSYMLCSKSYVDSMTDTLREVLG